MPDNVIATVRGWGVWLAARFNRTHLVRRTLVYWQTVITRRGIGIDRIAGIGYAALKENSMKEPALLLGLVGAAIALGVGFGLPVTPAQVGLIMAFVSAVLALVIRAQVVPATKVDDLIRTAVALPAGTAVATVKAEQAAKDS